MVNITNWVTNNVIEQVGYAKRRTIKKAAYYLSIAAWVTFAMFPVYWMFVTSFREDTFTTSQYIIPSLSGLTLDNYVVLLDPVVVLLLFNTLVIATGVMGLSVLLSTFAGYGLTRYDFPFKLSFARIILFGYMIAPIVIVIPMYILFRDLGLLNEYIGIVFAHATVATPFGVWLMWKVFQTVPISQEEAAWMAGASRLTTFRKIAVPNALPGILAVALFAYAIVWGDFTYSRILLPQFESMTLSPGLMTIAQRGYFIDQGRLMTISVAMAVPPIFVAYWLQSYLLKGFKL